jgi:uncharacterized delta-60 repeat protein
MSVTRLARIIAVASAMLLVTSAPAWAVPGDMDPSFGGDGVVRTAFGRYALLGTSLTIQPDGKIIVAGGATIDGADYKFALARYNPNGTLDTTFGGDGRVVTNLTRQYDVAWGVAVQATGKIVVAGDYGDGTANSAFGVVRYNPDGSRDTSFGRQGIVRIQFTRHADSASSLSLQPADDKIVVAGTAGADSRHARFGVARLTVNGHLDGTFGGDGRVTTGFGRAYSFANGLSAQADGTILAAGGLGRGTRGKIAVARYLTDGSLDPAFSGDGRATARITRSSFAFGVGVQTTGAVVAAGTATGGADDAFAAVRFAANGSLDTSFGGGDGRVTLAFSGHDAWALGTTLQADDGIVLVGGTGFDTRRRLNAVVARLTPDGSIDTTFGGGDGRVIVNDTSGPELFFRTAIDTDGNIVTVGYGGPRFETARLLGA